MKKPYDPKLREAAEEFKAICEKYDCIGACLFVSPTHSEFVNELKTSWSVLRFEPTDQGVAIRMRSKRDDFPSKEAQRFATDSTVHAVTSIIEWSRQTHDNWQELLKLIRTKMTVLYSAWGEPDSIPTTGEESLD